MSPMTRQTETDEQKHLREAAEADAFLTQCAERRREQEPEPASSQAGKRLKAPQRTAAWTMRANGMVAWINDARWGG